MKPLIVGHRGNARHAPENTRVSYVQAIEAGATIVEMDTRLSSDGQVVLMHDETVDRTTNAKGRVDEMTAQQLAQLDAGSWKNPKYRGEPVPTLTQISEVCRDKATMMLDLKCAGQGPALARWIAQNRYPLDQLILAPWEIEEGVELRRLIPGAVIMLISETPVDDAAAWVQRLKEAGFDGLSIDHQILAAAVVNEAHHRHMKVYTWTVNDPPALARAAALNVDGIITDDPAQSTRRL
jgi:glycerophosphoryl diester phosphodiesterase